MLDVVSGARLQAGHSVTTRTKRFLVVSLVLNLLLAAVCVLLWRSDVFHGKRAAEDTADQAVPDGLEDHIRWALRTPDIRVRIERLDGFVERFCPSVVGLEDSVQMNGLTSAFEELMKCHYLSGNREKGDKAFDYYMKWIGSPGSDL